MAARTSFQSDGGSGKEALLLPAYFNSSERWLYQWPACAAFSVLTWRLQENGWPESPSSLKKKSPGVFAIPLAMYVRVWSSSMPLEAESSPVVWALASWGTGGARSNALPPLRCREPLVCSFLLPLWLRLRVLPLLCRLVWKLLPSCEPANFRIAHFAHISSQLFAFTPSFRLWHQGHVKGKKGQTYLKWQVDLRCSQ